MLPFLFRRRRERELSEEIRSHFDMAVEERIERGQSREEAERAVRREFGNEVHVREVTRMMWGGMWLDRLAQDLRFGVRSLVRDRGFAFVAVLTLGLGIGVTTAMFTVVNGVLLRPLPFFEPDRLVSVSIQSPGEMTGDVASQRVLDAHFVEIRRDSSPFSFVSTYTNYPPVTLTGAGDPVRLNAGHVTSEFMQVLGVEPRLGTGFRSGDDRLASDPVVVLSDALWRERFTADPGVIGRYATIEGVDRRIVGVMPSGFAFPNRADLWIPLPVEPADHSLERPVVARLLGDMTTQAATDVLSARFVGRVEGELRAALTPLKDVLVGEGRYPLMVLVGAVVMVLLIACTNVANLLLMRARRREGEMGLRKVLGAGKGRLVRQLLTESTLVALLGGCVGVVVAIVGVEVLVAVAPWGTLPRSEELGVDWTALAFTLCLSGVTGIASD